MTTEKTLLMVSISLLGLEDGTSNIYKFYSENNDLTCECIFARKGKKLDPKRIQLDDFKGKKGSSGVFENIEIVKQTIRDFLDKDYRTIRMTRHKENAIADELFDDMMRYSMSKTDMKMNF